MLSTAACTPLDLSLERRYRSHGYKRLAGIDEAGRGALAGPVVAATVIFADDLQATPKGVRDSKQLSRIAREALMPQIQQTALAWGVGSASRGEIDQLNILRATLLAMQRAVLDLEARFPEQRPDFLLIDGNERLPQNTPQATIVDGDALCLSIAAASILAKVSRDRIMSELHERFPLFGFAQHMGYGTAEHRLALQRLGPCIEHRISFRGVR